MLRFISRKVEIVSHESLNLPVLLINLNRFGVAIGFDKSVQVLSFALECCFDLASFASIAVSLLFL